jgi:mannose-1-phosphate guanylyltransferase
MIRTAVIMAGGSGERFWPLSRARKPKQLLPLLSEKMMIEETIERIDGIIAVEDIYIITSKALIEPIRKALPNIPAQNIIAEPYKRNTAPCLALAAAFISAKYAEKYSSEHISVAVLTADQDINPIDGFKATLNEILEFVEKDKSICTIGINPVRPETGYGYVEVGDAFKSPDKCEIKKVLAFREKPNFEIAKQYAASGLHLWNSGMFFFRLDTFIEGLIKHLPDVGNGIANMRDKYLNNTNEVFESSFDAIDSIFEAFPDISIDYGLMEKSDNIYTANALFSWDDVGSWDALDRVKGKDANGNVADGEIGLVDCSNSIIINKSSNKDMIIGAIGLDDFVVVATDDSVMICPKDKVQDVKKCVQLLRKESKDKWL